MLSGIASSSPELVLLRTIARLELSTNEQNLLRDLVAGPLDWEQLLALSSSHGLQPLLFFHLNRFAAADVSPEIMRLLRDQYKEVAWRNLILASKLLAVSAHFRSRKIDHIAYKGPLLAEVYYGNAALRVSLDLDLIVRPDKVAAATDALGEIGFRDKNDLNATQQAAAFRFGFQHLFTAAGLDLDLHWRVVPKFISPSLDMAGIWERVSPARVFDGEVPTFCPEDLLVALCLHASQHEWGKLSNFCDMAQLLLRHPELNWEVVCSHLGDSNTMRIVSVSLHLLHQHWRAQLPQEMLARIAADPHVARVAHRVEAEIWPAPESAPLPTNLGWLLDRTAGQNMRDRLSIFMGFAFNPTLEDFRVFRLPHILAPVYPGLRALRLARKYTSSK